MKRSANFLEKYMTAQRFDIYRQIHKAMRASMCDAMLAAGEFDPMDDGARTQFLTRVREMLSFARGHLDKEDKFIHPAMELRAPGSTKVTAEDHASHEKVFRELDETLEALEQSSILEKPAAAHALYGKLAHFVGENLLHMQVEESANNEILWRTHSDQEILALECAIVASLSPQERAYSAQWMLPFANPQERLHMLRAMQPMMPPEAFAGLLRMLEAKLSPENWRQLEMALGQPSLAA